MSHLCKCIVVWSYSKSCRVEETWEQKEDQEVSVIAKGRGSLPDMWLVESRGAAKHLKMHDTAPRTDLCRLKYH